MAHCADVPACVLLVCAGLSLELDVAVAVLVRAGRGGGLVREKSHAWCHECRDRCRDSTPRCRTETCCLTAARCCLPACGPALAVCDAFRCIINYSVDRHVSEPLVAPDAHTDDATHDACWLACLLAGWLLTSTHLATHPSSLVSCCGAAHAHARQPHVVPGLGPGRAGGLPRLPGLRR